MSDICHTPSVDDMEKPKHFKAKFPLLSSEKSKSFRNESPHSSGRRSFLKQSLKIPVIGAPLFIISNPDLVVEQCKSGVVGSFPALNARPKEQLDDWLCEINERLDKYNTRSNIKAAPFAINQIVHKTNDRVEHDMELTVKHKVPIVITSLGARKEVYDAVHSYGGIVFHDIINNFLQKRQ